MAKKKRTAPFTKKGIGELPKDKPIVYKILTNRGLNLYTGSAKKGRVDDRLLEHLPGGPDPVPGTKVQIEQKSSIKKAQEAEARIISKAKPRFNKQGK